MCLRKSGFHLLARRGGWGRIARWGRIGGILQNMYPFVKHEQEIDMVLEKNGVFNDALQDWTKKWAPIILEYSTSLSGKKAMLATQICKDSEGVFLLHHVYTNILYMIHIILQESHVMTIKLL